MWWNASGHIYLRAKGVQIGKNVKLYGLPIISRHPNSEIVIAPNCVLCSDSRFTDLGVNHPVIIRTLRKGARIEIGHDSGLSGTSICSTKSISIGSGCLMGANVVIADTDFHPILSIHRRYDKDIPDSGMQSIEIERNVFIGESAHILKGSKIGENSVIGAGSVVTGHIPANSIWAGNPARHIKELPLASRS